MPAFVIVELTVTDPEGYEAYKGPAAVSVAEHGGTYLVRGGGTEKLEGDTVTHRVVVLQFPDGDAARGWYESADYQAVAPMRWAAADTVRMYVIEGYEQS